jgi:hypothetical protein
MRGRWQPLYVPNLMMIHSTTNSSQLYSDTQTFHSELKKCVACAVVEDYHLLPPKHLQTETEWIEFVKTKVTQLLKNVQFLCGPPDSNVSTCILVPCLELTLYLQGKTSNFAHSSLKRVCLVYFYSSSDKALHQFADFQECVLDRALLLDAVIVRSHYLPIHTTDTFLDSFQLGNIHEAWVQQEHNPHCGTSRGILQQSLHASEPSCGQSIS